MYKLSHMTIEVFLLKSLSQNYHLKTLSLVASRSLDVANVVKGVPDRYNPTTLFTFTLHLRSRSFCVKVHTVST